MKGVLQKKAIESPCYYVYIQDLEYPAHGEGTFKTLAQRDFHLSATVPPMHSVGSKLASTSTISRGSH